MKKFTKFFLTLLLLCVAGVANAGEQKTIFTIDYSTVDAYPYYRMGTPGGSSFDVIDGVLVIQNDSTTGNVWDLQPFIADGFTVQEGYSYLVKIDYKTTTAGGINIAFGNWSASMAKYNVGITVADDFQTLELLFDNATFGSEGDNHILWQCRSIEGTMYIQKVEVIEIEPDVPLKPVEDYEWTNIIPNSDLSGDDVSCFVSKEYPSTEMLPATIEEGAIKVVSPAQVEGGNAWDSQFWIVIPQAMPAGTKFKVSFRYKATADAIVATQCHNEPSQYIHWACIGDIEFTTKWKTFETIASVPGECDGGDNQGGYKNDFHSIAFNLTTSQDVTYYFDNVVVALDVDVAENPQPLPVILATFDFNASNYAVSSNDSNAGDITEDRVITEGGVTMTISPKDPSNSNPNRFWSTSNGPQLRMYSGTMTLEAPEDMAISKVEIAQTRWNINNTFNGESNEGNDRNIWTGNSTNVILAVAGNTQMNKVVVTLVDKDESTTTYDPNAVKYEPAFADGTYYVKNAYTGKMLATNGLDKVGAPVAFTFDEYAGYTAVGSDLFADKQWIAEGDGYFTFYTIVEGEKKYAGLNTADEFVLLDDATAESATWILLTPDYWENTALSFNVAGTADLCVNEWDTTGNKMTRNAESGLFEWTAENITVSYSVKPEFKIVANDVSDMDAIELLAWYPSGENWIINPEVTNGEGIFTIKIFFNMYTKYIYVTAEKTGDLPVAASPYYLTGNFIDWTADEKYNMTLNTEATCEEYKIDVTLAADAILKVVKQDDSGQTWYPDGTGNAFGEHGELAAAGDYTVYFRPNGDGGDDWFYHYILVVPLTTDGINAVSTAAQNNVIFNMAGQRVMKAQKGLYIVNGKKVLVK